MSTSMELDNNFAGCVCGRCLETIDRNGDCACQPCEHSVTSINLSRCAVVCKDCGESVMSLDPFVEEVLKKAFHTARSC